MADRQHYGPLILGLIMVVLGSLFLAANLVDFRVDWLYWLRFVLPTLLLVVGILKLLRHFSWDADRLAQRPGKGSLLSGLFWAAVGLIGLLHLAGVLGGLSFFGLYWPFLLVLFGLGKIIDYYRLEGRLQFRATEVIGLILIILLGVGAGHVSRAHWPLLRIPLWSGDGDFGIGDLVGEKYVWAEEESLPASALQQIEISNLYGDVRIQGGSMESVDVRLTKEVFEASEEEAKGRADQVRLINERTGNTLRLKTNREDLDLDKTRFKSHFEITLPPQVAVTVKNAYGNVRVSDLEAPCTIDLRHGDAVVENLSGELELQNAYGRAIARNIEGSVRIENRRGAVSAEGISGNASLHNVYGDITASDVSGKLDATNRFGQVRANKIAGSVEVNAPGSLVSISDVEEGIFAHNSHKSLTVKRLKKGLDLETSYSKVEIEDVSGQVSIQAHHSDIAAREVEGGIRVIAKGSKVRLDGVRGGFEVATSLRAAEVIDFSGPGDVKNEYGEILLTTRNPLTAPILAANKNGKITLVVPEGSSFRLSAQAPGGAVLSEFEGGDPQGVPALDATVGGGGPEVRLQTTYADIQVKKR